MTTTTTTLRAVLVGVPSIIVTTYKQDRTDVHKRECKRPATRRIDGDMKGGGMCMIRHRESKEEEA